MREFVAFVAAINLLLERGMAHVIHNTYNQIIEVIHTKSIEQTNFVKNIYAPFTVQELNDKMVELLKPADVKTEVKLVFQSIEGLHTAIPEYNGDWYFSGNYPTPGGTRLTNLAYKNFYEEDFRKY